MEFIYTDLVGQRLDKFLSLECSDLSRSEIQKIIKKGCVLVNGKNEKTSYMLLNGDKINIENVSKNVVKLKCENIDLEILYEDKDFFVENKPAG